MKLAWIGNYNVDFTTEWHRTKSLEKLGHEVIRLQENKTSADDVRKLIGQVGFLGYSHTHSPQWEIEGLLDVFNEYKNAGIPTASVHLDRYAGLQRETDVGRESSFFTEWYFSADGSPEMAQLIRKTGQKYHWLKPGVYGPECYMAEPDRKRFPHDVIFVGSKGYHHEYNMRPRLINWLQEVYGERFAHYGGDGYGTIRGDDLNTLYASAKVVVGDSCFAGMTSNYTSDRYYETPGRGGFLLMPEIEGVHIPGVPTYRPGDMLHLRELIDYFLEIDEAREECRIIAHEHVKKHETYTNRSKEMLEIMFPDGVPETSKG